MQITFLFYDGMTALDAAGPHEILCRLPGISVKRVAKSLGKITTDIRKSYMSNHVFVVSEWLPKEGCEHELWVRFKELIEDYTTAMVADWRCRLFSEDEYPS